jgi:hypothetical protein
VWPCPPVPYLPVSAEFFSSGRLCAIYLLLRWWFFLPLMINVSARRIALIRFHPRSFAMLIEPLMHLLLFWDTFFGQVFANIYKKQTRF